MRSAYRLKQSLITEYEWNKGPMPSGYAKLRLQLRPNLRDEKVAEIVIPPSMILKVRPTEYAKKKPLHNSVEEAAFTEMVVKGVMEGVREALTQSLDKPVIYVTVALEEVTIDLMYSTEMAFRIASRSAVEKLLKQAAEEGLLTTSSGG